MRYSEKNYVELDPFSDERDSNIRCRSVKLVKVRKSHYCYLSRDYSDNGEEHDVKKGEYARFDKVIYEGKWAGYYCCTNCMDNWFDVILGDDGERRQ